MHRTPDEPTFVFTTKTSVQVWSLDVFRQYLALDWAWSRSMNLGAFYFQALMPGEVVPRNATLVISETGAGIERTVHEGVPFVKASVIVNTSALTAWEDDAPVYTFTTWLPDLSRFELLPDLDGLYRLSDGGLAFHLTLPEL